MTKVGADAAARRCSSGIARAFKADVLAAVDPAARAAYEAKVAQACPRVETWSDPERDHRPDQRRSTAATERQPRAARQGPVLRRDVHRFAPRPPRSAARRTSRASRCR